MAYRTPNSSPSGSQSPPSAAASRNVSPSSQTASLLPAPMVPVAEGTDPQGSRSARGTPNRISVDLPRSQTASKGGCWTCRLRRKKCDEQREGDSCHTCIRLKIKCLGWGPKRPEWMRDKQAVEAYKADIKAQLTRAGLIRGQPRSSLMQTAPTPTPVVPSQSRSTSYRHLPAVADAGPSLSPFDLDTPSIDYRYGYAEASHSHQHRHTLIPAMPGASNSSFRQLPGSSYSDPNINALELNPPYFHYSPQSTPLSASTTTPLSSTADHLNFDFTQLTEVSETSGFEFELRPPSPLPSFPLLSGQNSIQGNCVMYYFEHVRKVQYIFAGNSVTNVTYSLIVQEPRGAVTNAVCALASLHNTRMLVTQGLEAPDPNPEHSHAKYFHDEAYYQLANAKQMHGHHTESDAIAALHLVSYSLFSGGVTDWQPVLGVALDWLVQSGLPLNENPRMTLANMSAAGQLIVKATMWFDIFSGLSLKKPPRFLHLYKRLFADRGGYWAGHMQGGELDMPQSVLRMETLTGCPDEAMLGIAEVSALAQWKTNEERNRSLSFRELIRRGDLIEQQLRQRHSDPAEMDQAPLHPNLPQPSSTAASGHATPTFPSDDMRRSVANIFRESVVLYLHTVLSGPNPSVPEISASVDTIVQLLNQLPSSELDRALVFPICLAGCMTDSSPKRDYLKGRLQSQDENIGNVMQTRALMEAVWRKRDTNVGMVDWQDVIGECPNLLLV